MKYKREYNYADSTWGYINEETATVIVGEKPMALNLYSVAKANPTFAAPALYLDCFSTVRKRYTFQVKAEGIKIENGDYITVTYSPLSIDAVRLLVLGVSYNLGDLLSGKPPIATITGIE